MKPLIILAIIAILQSFGVYAEDSAPPPPPPAGGEENPGEIKDAMLNQKLIYRVAVGRPEDVKILLSQGADPNAKNENDVPVIAIAADRWDGETATILKELVERGATINFPNGYQYNPLLLCIKNGHVEAVKYLMEKGANYYAEDERKVSALQLAQERGNQEIAAMIEDAIQKDREHEEALRSTENLNKLVRSYTFSNCAAQYTHYYLKSTQDAGEDKSWAARAQDLNETELARSADQLNSLFYVASAELKRVGEKCRQYITTELDTMVSNRNRRSKGVGTEEDMKKRCNKVASRWKARVVDDASLPPLPSGAVRKRIELESQDADEIKKEISKPHR